MCAVLDCESYETSLKCLAEYYEADISDVEGFLQALDLDGLYRENKIATRGDQYLKEVFEAEFACPRQRWEKIRWFHLTRIPPDTNFAEGILPLQLALAMIWKVIIASQSAPRKKRVLERLRDMGVPDFQYQFKTGSVMLGGPYAMLVREAAFRADEIRNHDYLRMPEIIEDICNGYERRTGERIFDGVAAVLRPCIVKFEVDSNGDDDHLIGVLLYYCWSKCHNETLCYLANTCFDAQGTAIPRSAILKVEYL